ncbi:MAG: UDP-N-acetylmuramyl-tripeptide synthetase [Candidatus Jorgensenbacteria bacterium]|nr:UDP-N-acetylmuramyl-tripeptide synthetase [Candidatus Jorgensenbacteria bacterium]
MKYISSIYHLAFAFIGNIIYGFPSHKIYVVGVTGTKGKSTTVEIMSSIFEGAGKKTSVMSSVTRKIGDKVERNMTGNTMPGRFAIQKFLRDAVKAGCEYAFIEITSQGVIQHRHEFIDWDSAVFLNLAPEHIESHGSFEKYRDAKVSFFKYVARSPKKKRTFFVNEKDESSPYFEDAVRHNFANTIIRFSGERFLRDELAERHDLRDEKNRRMFGDWLLAEFNLENAAAAYALATERGISWEVIEKALINFKGVPGRLELVQKKPFVVVIDYAHTPDSLNKLYVTLKRDYLEPGGRMICVLGSAGGGRDKWKRPEMGKIAAEFASFIILTNEDPYEEEPEDIMNDVRIGVIENHFSPAKLFEIVDRREAIRKALSLAESNDVVVMTGKGSETSINGKGGSKIPWGERSVCDELLFELGAGK